MVTSTAHDYEYRVLTFDRHTTRAEARAQVREHTEYGRWELTRSSVFEGGVRRMWLRRRIIRAVRTT